jgi:hypothetical protein
MEVHIVACKTGGAKIDRRIVVKEVVRAIAAHESEVKRDGVVDYDEIERFIEGVAHHEGGPDNVRRVAAKLAAAGWPLESFDQARE